MASREGASMLGKSKLPNINVKFPGPVAKSQRDIRTIKRAKVKEKEALEADKIQVREEQLAIRQRELDEQEKRLQHEQVMHKIMIIIILYEYWMGGRKCQ